MQVADVIEALETAYPPRLAEPWDTGIGLSVGDRCATVDSVLLAVDIDPATVAEAQRSGAQLIVTHHPLLFRAVQTVAAHTDKGALIHTMLRSGIAHFAAHTNADRAVGGVNDALAQILGLSDTSALVPADLSNAAPGEGLGRVGNLAEPMSLAAFTQVVADALPATASGVRAAGDPDRIVSRIAVCGGAGASELSAATGSGAHAYVTSDLSHHVVAEHVADPNRPAVIGVPHWAGEWPWLASAARIIRAAGAGSVKVAVSTQCTDPWTVHAATSTAE